jgi:chemotaxis protein histidine kinase CheA
MDATVMSEDPSILDQLKKDFIQETSLFLEKCEESFLNLELSPNKKEEIDQILQYSHSLKESDSLFTYEKFANFSKILENCLSLLRSHPEMIQTDKISHLLKTMGDLKEKLKLIKEENKQPSASDRSSKNYSDQDLWSNQEISLDQVRFMPNATAIDLPFEHPPVQNLVPQTQAVTASVATPVATPVTAPIATPVTAPIAAPVATPVTAPIAAPVATPVTGPIAAPIPLSPPTEPISEPVSEPISKKDDQLDSLLLCFGELVTARNQLLNQTGRYPTDRPLQTLASLIDKTTRDLENKLSHWVPLSLMSRSIMNGILIEIEEKAFIVPMEQVQELIPLTSDQSLIQMGNGSKFFDYQGKYLPIVDLKKALFNELKNYFSPVHKEQKEHSLLMIIKTKKDPIALLTKKMIGHVQVAIKPPPSPEFDQTRTISGISVLGDGNVALVIDPTHLQGPPFNDPNGTLDERVNLE